jgi:hypothetical protein
MCEDCKDSRFISQVLGKVRAVDTCEEGVEVGHVAELLHDFAVVADVVPVICIWRVKMGTQPDNVDTKFLKVVELRVMPGRSPIPSPFESLKERG